MEERKISKEILEEKLEIRNWMMRREIGNWGEQHDSMKVKFPISNFEFRVSIANFELKFIFMQIRGGRLM